MPCLCVHAIKGQHKVICIFSTIPIVSHLLLGDRKGSISCIKDKDRAFVRVVIMSYKQKGFDNNAFELDVVDSPYGTKGM